MTAANPYARSMTTGRQKAAHTLLAIGIAATAGCGTPEDFAIAREGPLTAAPTPLTVTGDGVHVVGPRLPVGRYEVSFPMVWDSTGLISRCDWARLSSTENTPENLIADGSFETTFQYLEVEEGDAALYTSGCGTLTLVSG